LSFEHSKCYTPASSTNQSLFIGASNISIPGSYGMYTTKALAILKGCDICKTQKRRI
jgi:hypothetical protein